MLYNSAFPLSERKPFKRILEMQKKGKTDIWYIVHDGKFVGMATTVNSDDIVMVDYFAVDKRHRSKGLGTLAFREILDTYRDKGVFVEIEAVDAAADNAVERIRRKRFYCRCGLSDFGVSAKVFGVEMELLGIRCLLDYDGYVGFYRDNLSKFAADHISPVKR